MTFCILVDDVVAVELGHQADMHPADAPTAELDPALMVGMIDALLHRSAFVSNLPTGTALAVGLDKGDIERFATAHLL